LKAHREKRSFLVAVTGIEPRCRRCTHACIRTHTCTCIHTYHTQTCIHAHTHTYIHASTHTHACMHMPVYVRTHAWMMHSMHALHYMPTCMHACMHDAYIHDTIGGSARHDLERDRIREEAHDAYMHDTIGGST
jgi:hypothetical protein